MYQLGFSKKYFSGEFLQSPKYSIGTPEYFLVKYQNK